MTVYRTRAMTQHIIGPIMIVTEYDVCPCSDRNVSFREGTTYKRCCRVALRWRRYTLVCEWIRPRTFWDRYGLWKSGFLWWGFKKRPIDMEGLRRKKPLLPTKPRRFFGLLCAHKWEDTDRTIVRTYGSTAICRCVHCGRIRSFKA